MTVSVPRFAIKLAGREYSRWNLLITQFKYTGTLPNKSSSKSKKSEKSWRKAAELNDSACADPGTQGQLPTMGGAFRNWRRTAESNGHPCGAPVFQAGRDPHPRALQIAWPRAEESNPHPEGAPVFETGGGPSARARGGAPGENRTHHELLCRQPLRQLASGANLLAGGQGFEPCRNGFGVRRSSCRVMPPVVRAAGLEPAREPGLSRPPLPIGLRAHGAGGRIRTDKHGGLSSADKPILVRRHNLVARPGFEPGKSLPSEGSAFTNLTSGPWCPRWDSNPQQQPSQDCASTNCATWT
jgi:hypothetical protein